MASSPEGLAGCRARAQLSPHRRESQGQEPWAGLHFYSLRRLLCEINIERGHPDPTAGHPGSQQRRLREQSLVPTGSKCWAQAGSRRPTEAEARDAQVLGEGYGEEGAWVALLLLARGGPIFSRWGN